MSTAKLKSSCALTVRAERSSNYLFKRKEYPERAGFSRERRELSFPGVTAKEI